MRNSKIITIEGRGEVTVKEVSPLGVWRAFRAEDYMMELRALLDDALEPATAEIFSWYPSEQKQVVEAFYQVNASFFDLARLLKVDGLIRDGLNGIMTSFNERWRGSFNLAMPAPGDTAGVSS